MGFLAHPAFDKGGDLFGAVAHEGADVAHVLVSFNVGGRPFGEGEAGRMGDVSIVCAEDDEDGAFGSPGRNASVNLVHDGAGFVSPALPGPKDRLAIAVRHGVFGVFEGAILPDDEGWVGLAIGFGADAFRADAVHEDDGTGRMLFVGFEGEDAAHAGSDVDDFAVLGSPRQNLADVVVELRVFVLTTNGHEVAIDDGPTGLFEDGTPLVVLPPTSAGTVDHDDRAFGGEGKGGDGGEHMPIVRGGVAS